MPHDLMLLIGIKPDLHTRIGAVWSDGKETVFARGFEVEAKTLTGAGDSWDSANIIGYLSNRNGNKISTFERLMFSNAFASLYVSNPNAEPSSIVDTLKLLENIPDSLG